MTMRRTCLLAALLIGCNGEEECTDWFCEDGNGTASTTDGKGGTTKSGTKTGTKTGTKSSADFTVGLEVSAVDGLGQLWIEGVDGCVSNLGVDSATERTDCAACDLAFDLEIGSGGTDSAPCAIEGDWAGTTLTLGHADPASLYFYKSEWEDGYGFGTSAVAGDVWTVEMPAY